MAWRLGVCLTSRTSKVRFLSNGPPLHAMGFYQNGRIFRSSIFDRLIFASPRATPQATSRAIPRATLCTSPRVQSRTTSHAMPRAPARATWCTASRTYSRTTSRATPCATSIINTATRIAGDIRLRHESRTTVAGECRTRIASRY